MAVFYLETGVSIINSLSTQVEFLCSVLTWFFNFLRLGFPYNFPIFYIRSVTCFLHSLILCCITSKFIFTLQVCPWAQTSWKWRHCLDGEERIPIIQCGNGDLWDCCSSLSKTANNTPRIGFCLVRTQQILVKECYTIFLECKNVQICLVTGSFFGFSHR